MDGPGEKMGLVVVRDGERDRKMLRSESRTIGSSAGFRAEHHSIFLYYRMEHKRPAGGRR